MNVQSWFKPAVQLQGFGLGDLGRLGDFEAPKGSAAGAVQLGVAAAAGYGAYKLWPKHKVWGTILGLVALGWAGGAASAFSREA